MTLFMQLKKNSCQVYYNCFLVSNSHFSTNVNQPGVHSVIRSKNLLGDAMKSKCVDMKLICEFFKSKFQILAKTAM